MLALITCRSPSRCAAFVTFAVVFAAYAGGCGSGGATTSEAAGTAATTGAASGSGGGITGTSGTGGQGGMSTSASASTSTSTSTSTSGSGGSGGEGTTGPTGSGGQGVGGGPSGVDADLDGIDDGTEEKLAKGYLPYLSIDPADGCKLGGIVYRVSPHPADASRIFVLYDHLYETDCGLTKHTGDNEAFGITIDPTKPAPSGILSIIAIGHQNTFCQQISTCGQCGNLTPCDTAMWNGAAWPIVYSSKDKHANYALLSACNPIIACLDTCVLAPTPTKLPMVNAGEPDAHLTENLTTDGFITAANGWTKMELFDHNPWDPMVDFGGAGNVAGDLVDPAFVPPACP